MKVFFLVGLVFAVTTYGRAAQSASSRLKGCIAPDVIVGSLKKLRDSNWSAVSPARIMEIWPSPIRALECKGETCSSWVREGRIINGQIECEDVFDFDESADGNTGKEQLHAVTIHYTAGTRSEIIAIARMFANAIGMPLVSVKTIGQSNVQLFQWEDSMGKMSGLDLQLNPVGPEWNLFFVYGRLPS